MRKLKQAAMDVLRWLNTGGHTIIPLSVRDEFVEEHKTALRAALAEHEAAPPRDPDDDLIAKLQDARNEAAFYRRRCEALQQWQSHMRDPERTIVCDILANGCMLPAEAAGDRYKFPPADRAAAPPRELSEEENRALCESAEYEAEEKHFAARPQINFIAYRTPFRAGFERGWDAARAIERKVREG